MASDRSENEAADATGGCLCGAVKFEIRGPLRSVTICHCAMCRRAGTSVGAYTACAPDRLAILGSELRWFQSSPIARRGFCATCGSQLFWEPNHGRHVSISAGAIDDRSRLVAGEHIFRDGTDLPPPA